MHQRFLAITFLAVTVLFSQGGGSLIVALCPHLTSVQASCHSNVSELKMAHDHIDGMVMGETDSMASMEEPIPNPDPNALAMGQPGGWCPHCSVHAPTTPNAASFREVESLKRPGAVAVPDAAQPEVTPAESCADFLTSRAHGPPGNTTPRHILLNIFRI